MFKTLNQNRRHTGCTRCNYVGCSWKREQYPTLGHWIWTTELYNSKLGKYFKKLIKSFTDFDYSRIEDVKVSGIDFKDYPDFSDAYIESASYKGKPMTETQLERINEDYDFVYDQVIKRVY